MRLAGGNGRSKALSASNAGNGTSRSASQTSCSRRIECGAHQKPCMDMRSQTVSCGVPYVWSARDGPGQSAAGGLPCRRGRLTSSPSRRALETSVPARGTSCAASLNTFAASQTSFAAPRTYHNHFANAAASLLPAFLGARRPLNGRSPLWQKKAKPLRAGAGCPRGGCCTRL